MIEKLIGSGLSEIIQKKILTAVEVKAEVEARLERLLDARIEQALKIDPSYQQLLLEIKKFIMRGGKRMRPYLTYLSYAGYGGSDREAILDVAASQELYHNFLLIHDDIIDRDTVRYGGPNISGRYREFLKSRLSPETAAHYSDGVALLAGDINSGLALEMILDSSFDDVLKVRAARRMARMIFEIAGGELADVLVMFDPDEDVTEERLLSIMRSKTASYSFSTPLQLGAILAGAGQDELDRIEELAAPLGIAFQITDDLLGMFGDEAVTGKPSTSDLKEGKRTLLIHYGLQLASPQERQTISHNLGNKDLGGDGHQKVAEILETCGAHARAQAEAAKYATLAGDKLNCLNMSKKVQAVLIDLTAFTVSRNK